MSVTPGRAVLRSSLFLILSVLLLSCFAGAQAIAPLPPGSWRFIVSGDSRNCGDVVMPAIAAHSKQYHPKFYWHLGDLRAIYKVDEDMLAAATLKHEKLTCSEYRQRAWNDFIDNQIKAFDGIPFYLGIGNHEVIPPKNGDVFKRQFRGYLDMPQLRQQRLADGEPSAPETYFHWVERGVDFIYLDNSNNFFPEAELTWFFRRLSDAMYSPDVKSVVVGMHEALPDSIANDHSMGSDPRGASTGQAVYNALLAFQKKKPVYVLASHSHFYLANIFDTDALKAGGKTPLPGWIAGAGGAERYLLPDRTPWLQYGYMLATVTDQGTIEFEFKNVEQKDIPDTVKERYPPDLVQWCWENNSKLRPPHPVYSAQSCPLPTPDAEKATAKAAATKK